MFFRVDTSTVNVLSSSGLFLSAFTWWTLGVGKLFRYLPVLALIKLILKMRTI